VIATLEAYEKAQAMLTEARVRKEREAQMATEKEKWVSFRVGNEEGVDKEGVNDQMTSSEEDLEVVSRQLRKTVRKRREGSDTTKKKIMKVLF
jgi:hypothetical protein